jgi:hypothetical protein
MQERKKRKKEGGARLGQEERERKMHSNAFEFKSKI